MSYRPTFPMGFISPPTFPGTEDYNVTITITDSGITAVDNEMAPIDILLGGDDYVFGVFNNSSQTVTSISFNLNAITTPFGLFGWDPRAVSAPDGPYTVQTDPSWQDNIQDFGTPPPSQSILPAGYQRNGYEGPDSYWTNEIGGPAAYSGGDNPLIVVFPNGIPPGGETFFGTEGLWTNGDDAALSVTSIPAGEEAGTVRYIEKWALETECVGATLSKIADSFIVYSGAPTATLSGLSHLEGKAVVVWADGVDFSPDDVNGVQRTYTVAGGAITLDSAVSNAVIGLPYTAQWQSAKLARDAQLGTALTQRKRISELGLILVDAHPYGLKVGQDFAYLDDLPLVRDHGNTIDPNTVQAAEDISAFPINGTWDTDSRLCLQAKAPRCVNVLAAVMTISENDKG